MLAISVAFAMAVVPTVVRADDPLYVSAPNGLPPGCGCIVVGAPQAVPLGAPQTAGAVAPGAGAATGTSDSDDLGSDASRRQVGTASATTPPRADDAR